jgi:hypothetical protein
MNEISEARMQFHLDGRRFHKTNMSNRLPTIDTQNSHSGGAILFQQHAEDFSGIPFTSSRLYVMTSQFTLGSPIILARA